MSPELASALKAVSGVATLLVAIVSIVIALSAEKRNHDRFQAELDLSRDLTAASIRPLLSVYSQVADELKSNPREPGNRSGSNYFLRNEAG